MQYLKVKSPGGQVDFAGAKRLADSNAEALLAEPMLLSWFDKARGIESPKGVSECNQGCPTHGVIQYAENRDGALVVDIDEGSYLFCYRALGEFAGI